MIILWGNIKKYIYIFFKIPCKDSHPVSAIISETLCVHITSTSLPTLQKQSQLPNTFSL